LKGEHPVTTAQGAMIEVDQRLAWKRFARVRGDEGGKLTWPKAQTAVRPCAWG
jgi:hypothetical protein